VVIVSGDVTAEVSISSTGTVEAVDNCSCVLVTTAASVDETGLTLLGISEVASDVPTSISVVDAATDEISVTDSVLIVSGEVAADVSISASGTTEAVVNCSGVLVATTASVEEAGFKLLIVSVVASEVATSISVVKALVD